MKQSRFTEEHIIGILKSVEAGQKVLDACRTHGISEATYHRWKTKYGGLDVSEARRLKHLEDENRRLKQLVADLTLDNAALKFCGVMSSSSFLWYALTKELIWTARNHPSLWRY